MIINILGQDYDFQEIAAKDDMRMADSDGYCDGFGKIIRVNNDYNTNHPTSISDMPGYIRKVKRHEVIHAFLEESGLGKYKGDEIIVDWIAAQFPKLEKAFQQVGGL